AGADAFEKTGERYRFEDRGRRGGDGDGEDLAKSSWATRRVGAVQVAVARDRHPAPRIDARRVLHRTQRDEGVAGGELEQSAVSAAWIRVCVGRLSIEGSLRVLHEGRDRFRTIARAQRVQRRERARRRDP